MLFILLIFSAHALNLIPGKCDESRDMRWMAKPEISKLCMLMHSSILRIMCPLAKFVSELCSTMEENVSNLLNEPKHFKIVPAPSRLSPH
jgi:hypothetical protein